MVVVGGREGGKQGVERQEKQKQLSKIRYW